MSELESDVTQGADPVDVGTALAVVDIADRYALSGTLGRGGFGSVHAALDRLTGREVAIKLVPCPSATLRARLGHEIAALRLLRIPGVVELLDDGALGDEHFLVMERVRGTPFPGGSLGQAMPWSAIEAQTFQLLDIIGRVHAAGILHRDLKPENILVEPSGRVVVLDFGLAMSSDMDALTRTGAFVGTPRYAAPEQIRGDTLEPATDLYAIGLMLYELLGSTPAHGTGDMGAVLARRLTLDPPPLRESGAHLPTHVSSVIDRMIARDPTRRYSNAEEVAQALRGDNDAGVDTLPWLGDDRAMSRLASELRRGRPVRVLGARGAGKSRLVAEIQRVLDGHGVECLIVVPGQKPFASLGTAAPDVAADARLEDVRIRIAASLAIRFAAGAVVIVDHAERVDPWTLAILRTAARGSAVLSTCDDFPGRRHRVAPLAPTALQRLFGGSELLLHQKSDAAEALWVRTAGHPRAVLEVLAAWRRRGIAKGTPEGVVVSRLALDALRRETSRPPTLQRPRRGLRTSRGLATVEDLLPESRQSLLDWLGRAYPSSTVELVGAALARPRWHIEAELEWLTEHGLADCDATGAWLGLARVGTRAQAEDVWRNPHERLAAALPEGSRERLLHLVSAGLFSRAIPAASLLARHWIDAGRAAEAFGMLLDVLPLARAHLGGTGTTGVGPSLVEAIAVAACTVGTPSALDTALYEIARLDGSESVSRLVRAVRAASTEMTAPSLAALGAAGPLPSEELELIRRVSCVRVARAVGAAVAESALLELESLAIGSTSERVRAEVSMARAQRAYELGHYAEGRAGFQKVAESEAPAHLRLRGLEGASACLVELFELREAGRLARRAIELAAQLRLPTLEGHAWWLARTVAFRAGQRLPVAHALVRAAAESGSTDLEALICATEAGFAWRAGDRADTVALATRVRDLWGGVGRTSAAVLFEALAFAASEQDDPALAATLVERAGDNPIPGFGIQILGLVGGATEVEPSLVRRLAAEVPRRHWQRPLDLLSVKESLERIGGRPGWPNRAWTPYRVRLVSHPWGWL